MSAARHARFQRNVDRHPRIHALPSGRTADIPVRRRAQTEPASALSRLTAELHDRVAQSLWALDAEIADLISDLPADPADTIRRLDDTRRLIGEAYRDVRLALSALRERPSVPESLVAAIQEAIDEFTHDSGISTHFVCAAHPTELRELTLIQVMAIVRQAFANVAQHAKASTVAVELRPDDDGWSLTIRDDGQGFPMEATSYPTQFQHYGLKIMRERANSFGGLLSVQSRRGEGTAVCVHIPANGSSPAS